MEVNTCYQNFPQAKSLAMNIVAPVLDMVTDVMSKYSILPILSGHTLSQASNQHTDLRPPQVAIENESKNRSRIISVHLACHDYHCLGSHDRTNHPEVQRRS